MLDTCALSIMLPRTRMLFFRILPIITTLIASTESQGIILTSPRRFTFVPGITPSPIQLTCDITPVAGWAVNNVRLFLTELDNSSTNLGHGRNGTNIVIINPMNNSEYFCSDGINDGEPYDIFVAGVPDMVPDVTVDNDTININGNNVTLTLSRGEPFNNLDPIVNYTVLCSGDVTCPPNFTTTDNTRSYTITNLTPMTTYTFSVVATNSIGSGEAGVVTITTPPGLPSIDSITVSGNMCFETSVIISWNSSSINNGVSYRGMVLSTSSEVLYMFNTNNAFIIYNFTEFNESTIYFVIIASVNMLGNGIYGNSTFYIPGQDDFALGGVTINNPQTRFNSTANQTVLIVTWEPLMNQYCPVLYYIITVSTTDVPRNNVSVNVSSSTLIARFNVNNNTQYNITVVAFNRASSGPATSRTKTVNPDSPPPPPPPPHCLICWIILAVILIIIVHTSVGVPLRCHCEECPDESISYLVLLVILGVLTLGISNLIWYIYFKCQKKAKCSSLLFVSVIVSHILAFGLPALLWCLIRPCCIKKKEDKSDTGDTPLTSPNRVKPVITKSKKDETTQQLAAKEGTAPTQAKQTDTEQYAVVDKAAIKQKNKCQKTELNYLPPEDLEIKEGPEIRFEADHTVQYGEFGDKT